MTSVPEYEAETLLSSVKTHLPRRIDGKDAIRQMKQEGSRNWRQMEWIGFWFEHFFEKSIWPDIGGQLGPRFGNTSFDVRRNFVWDLKAHPTSQTWMLLNDCEAVQDCIRATGGLGFIVVHGDVDYDTTGAFKAWHDDFKGGTSQYEKNRVARGAPSRRRKSAFVPKRIDAVYLRDVSTVETALTAGWMAYFQENMRNSDGSPRRAKYQMNPDAVPRMVRLASRSIP
jgi:hypothetical protein